MNKREREEFVSQSPSGPFFLLFLNLVGLILTVLYMVEKKKKKKSSSIQGSAGSYLFSIIFSLIFVGLYYQV